MLYFKRLIVKIKRWMTRKGLYRWSYYDDDSVDFDEYNGFDINDFGDN